MPSTSVEGIVMCMVDMPAAVPRETSIGDGPLIASLPTEHDAGHDHE
ncbi:hypothetical protein QSJ18_15215 [Gordonia sp. ABSL1-1]|nr:hypothetical protein [Gordonia sp. ABSL1-1]MDL9938102.1 hypothetical protein [Gordonia sp. ABSL1-1]